MNDLAPDIDVALDQCPERCSAHPVARELDLHILD